MSISLKANSAGTQGEILLNGTTINTVNPTGLRASTAQDTDASALTRKDYVDKVVGVGRTWKNKTITPGVNYTNNSGADIELAIVTTSLNGTSVMAIDSTVRVCVAWAVQNQYDGMLYATIPPGGQFAVNGVSGSVASLSCAVLINGPVTGITP